MLAYHTECGTNFVLVRTVVHFGRKLDTLVSDYRADHNRMDATSSHLPHQGVSKIVPAANLHPDCLRSRMQLATASITGIDGRSLAGAENPFVTRTEQAKPTNKLRMLGLVKWQQLLFLGFQRLPSNYSTLQLVGIKVDQTTVPFIAKSTPKTLKCSV